MAAGKDVPKRHKDGEKKKQETATVEQQNI